MERVRKTYFSPLATSKAQIQEILQELPVGSAHPFSPEHTLLCRTNDGVDEIDISSYPEDFFFNAVDLGEMGEILLRRMAGFRNHLAVFEDFQIMQAPDTTFKIPIVSGQITILAVSERTPTYYDFCFADASCNTCCWTARNTFSGISHSGDILNGQDLLDYVKIDAPSLTEKEICVFISGYQSTKITRFLGTSPALMVADHVDKILYIIPVPLDAATIGDATICCPLVIKRDEESLICSILPKATTDVDMMCSTSRLESPSFLEAIQSAEFTITPPRVTAPKLLGNGTEMPEACSTVENLSNITAKRSALLVTNAVSVPSFINTEETQIIRFGTNLEFKLPNQELSTETQPSSVVLPCIFGSQLQGPVLLATGKVPANIPFGEEAALRNYYGGLDNIIVIVDDRMTDNARNIASSYRLNALFIVQLKPDNEPKNSDEVLSLLDSANINAVTALSGPQSLVLVQILNKYYFYRGIANSSILNTTKLAFGSDVTSIVESAGMEAMTDLRVKRIISLADENTIILPNLNHLVKPQELKDLFAELPIEKLNDMEEDISAAIPQLQVLLNQKELQDLSQLLVSSLSIKVSNAVAPLRDAYIHFFKNEYQASDPESVKKKNELLGDLRRTSKRIQKALEPIISSFANMMSSQTTSKRTHDLKRLVRQAQINSNVEAAKSMTYETLAGYLEEHAMDMGVMLLNIETDSYCRLLGNLDSVAVDASSCCNLDSRVLHLEGFDAGIILEQSQTDHSGPLQSQAGPTHPILAVPYLGQDKGVGSMLAWVCWDEFVNLESPYGVRWMEKCNEAHIAALRIMVRDTLSNAVASREHNLQAGAPEIGHLMGALLMAAMSKLAAMRTTAPVVIKQAEDTVTKLMRGLYGNLLTIAGSGVRPLSMVWQLFGQNPKYDLPTTNADWVWYDTVVDLYPYTGWQREWFYASLERFLDKAILRVVTKGEDVKEIKGNRVTEMIKYCRLRNIELEHCRSIITVFMRMLTEENVDLAAVATRLLANLPHSLERQSKSYTKMIKYLKYLSERGERIANDDLAAANIYNKRSAVFGELKGRVATACRTNDWAELKEACQLLVEKHSQIAALWQVKPQLLLVQNIKPYKELLEAEFGEDITQGEEASNFELTRKVLSDAEINRVPWQVGKEGQFGDKIEPLDEAFVHEMLTGKRLNVLEAIEMAEETILAVTKEDLSLQSTEEQFSNYKSSLQASFINTMQKDLSAEDVCNILKIPVRTMKIFIKALNPEFVWEDLSQNFKVVILSLVKNRSSRDGSEPAKRLLNMVRERKQLEIEG